MAKKHSFERADEQESALKIEVKQLRSELLSSRTLINQLLEETSHEKFDERRVNALKAQVIQLERQLVLLSNAASCRADALIDIENSALHIRNMLSDACNKNQRSSDVPIPRNELMKAIQLCDTVQQKISKTGRLSSKESLETPLLTRSKFLRTRCSLQDVCSGKLEHLSLASVSALESRLCALYKRLLSLRTCLSTHNVSAEQAAQDVSSAAVNRLRQMSDDCVDSLAAGCADLLELSLLVPSAPWGIRSNPLLTELTADSAAAAAHIVRAKHADVKSFVQTLAKASNHKCVLAGLKIQSLEEELAYHRKVYEVQVKYVDELLEALRLAYTTFTNDLHTSLSVPLFEILEAHAVLKMSTSEENLRAFFSAVKDNAGQLENVLKSLQARTEKDAHEAFASYRDNFLQTLKSCRASALSECNLHLGLIAANEAAARATQNDGETSAATLSTLLTAAMQLSEDGETSGQSSNESLAMAVSYAHIPSQLAVRGGRVVRKGTAGSKTATAETATAARTSQTRGAAVDVSPKRDTLASGLPSDKNSSGLLAKVHSLKARSPKSDGISHNVAASIAGLPGK